jgi:hypothetical protein
MVLRYKVQMDIPLCWMISMSAFHLALKIDVLKMEQAFQTNYWEEDKVFYVSSFNCKGEEEFQEQHMCSWNWHWMFENDKFEFFLLVNLDLKSLSKCMFFVWDGNNRLQAWLLTLTICMMMSPFSTSLLIPLSLTPLMGLLTFSLPWQSSTSMFLSLFFFPTLN